MRTQDRFPGRATSAIRVEHRRRTIGLGVAFAFSAALVTPFFAGMHWHRYWGSIGSALLLACLVSFVAFVSARLDGLSCIGARFEIGVGPRGSTSRIRAKSIQASPQCDAADKRRRYRKLTVGLKWRPIAAYSYGAAWHERPSSPHGQNMPALCAIMQA